jgi:anti-sigma B factor antagonist
MNDISPERGLTLQIHTEADVTTVRCKGRLVAGVTDTLRDEVKLLISSNRRIVLDLTELAQLDSMGLGTIVSLYVTARAAHCGLELINLSPRVRELLGITNLLSVFEMCGEHRIKMH